MTASDATWSAASGPASASRRLVFLGTGTSTGVPILGCRCAICLSPDPRNRRLRSSVLLRLPGGDALIDTTPDVRSQLLREGVGFVRAIAYTHDHADHLFGLDDARLFPKHTGGPIPVYCEQAVEESIRRIFHYAFSDLSLSLLPGGVPSLRFVRIAPGAPFELLGESVTPIRLDHGRSEIVGFRIGDLAYCTDVKRIPDSAWPLLKGLRVLILGALRFDKHPTHFSLNEALEAIAKLQPESAYLTHLSHSFDHETVETALPESVRLAYDGLTLEF